MMQKARYSGWVVIERYSDNNKFIRIPRSRTFKTKEDADKERKSMTPKHGGEFERAETHEEKVELVAISKQIVREARRQIAEYRAAVR